MKNERNTAVETETKYDSITGVGSAVSAGFPDAIPSASAWEIHNEKP